MKKINRILWTSPHCWPDYCPRENGLGLKSQGGQTVVMYEATRALIKNNSKLKIDIYARMEKGEKRKKKLHKNVDMIRCDLGPLDRYLPKEEFWGPSIAEFVDNVDKYVKKHKLKYDLLHGHYADGWYVTNHLASKWKIPFILTTHSLGIRKKENALQSQEGTEKELDKKYNFPDRIQAEKEALKNADLILPLTHEEGKYIVKKYGISPKKIQVINNGVNRSDFYPIDKKKKAKLRKELKLDDNDLLVFQAGRVDPRKGQYELLKAAPAIIKQVKQKTGKNVKFCLVGWIKNDFSQKLERLIKKTKIQNNIILYPPVSHNKITPFFWLADVYALTSTYDIFPIVLLEAMCNKLPVVATKNGGPSEVISNEIDGILVEPRNTSEVVSALVEILSNDRKRQKMGQAAYKKVMKKYTWDKIVKQLDRIYLKIIDNSTIEKVSRNYT